MNCRGSLLHTYACPQHTGKSTKLFPCERLITQSGQERDRRGGGDEDRDRRRQRRDRRETKEGEEGYRQTETGRAFSREIVERQKGKGGGERYRQTETGRAFSRETGTDRKTKEREKDTDRRRQGEHVAGR